MNFIIKIIAGVIQAVIGLFTLIFGVILAGVLVILAPIGLFLLKFKIGKMMENQFKEMRKHANSTSQWGAEQHQKDTTLDGKTIDAEYTVEED